MQNGASKVVISDYATSTDQALMVPIQINIDRVQPEFVPEGTLHAVGHVWGQPVEDLIVPLPVNDAAQTGGVERSHEHGREDAPVDGYEENSSLVEEAVDERREEEAFRTAGQDVQGNREGRHREVFASGHDLRDGSTRRTATQGERSEAGGAENGRGRFDVIIMADLLFNRSQHAQLLETCDRCLRTGGSEEAAVWVSFSHHDPEKAELDMKFFALADEKGFTAKRIKTVSSVWGGEAVARVMREVLVVVGLFGLNPRRFQLCGRPLCALGHGPSRLQVGYRRTGVRAVPVWGYFGSCRNMLKLGTHRKRFVPHLTHGLADAASYDI